MEAQADRICTNAETRGFESAIAVTPGSVSLLSKIIGMELLLFPMCNHCGNWAWVDEEILAFGNMLRSTHGRELLFLKLFRPAYFVLCTEFKLDT